MTALNWALLAVQVVLSVAFVVELHRCWLAQIDEQEALQELIRARAAARAREREREHEHATERVAA